MTTLALLSDLHIGLGPRAEETQRIHRWCLDALRPRVLGGILLGGDFHDKRTLPEERNEGADLLLGLAEIAPVVGIYGNHDVPHDLDLYNRLRGRHPICFYDRPDVAVCGDTAIALLPWDREAPPLEFLTMTGAARAAAEKTARAAMLAALGAQLAAAPARSRLLLGHLMLSEAKIGTGQPEKRGRDFELSLEELGLVEAHGYLLGHVHRSQNWTIRGAPVFYPGSTIRRTYGEIERKYIALVHVEGSAVSVEWLETPATPMLLAEATWAELAPGRWGFTADLDAMCADAAGADVRFTYAVDPAHRVAAVLAATELKARLAAVGAGMVSAEEKVTPSARAKAPEIASAATLEEKLAITLTQKGHPAPQPQHGRVCSLFRELLATPGIAAGAMGSAGGTLHAIRMRGVGAFTEEVVFDLDAIGGDIVAVAGHPGEGKSTLLEAWPGILHPRRCTPTRGSFEALAANHGRDAFVEVTFSSGSQRVRIHTDVNREKAQVYVDDVSLDEIDGKVSRLADWSARTQLPPEVMNAGIFLSQRSEGLIAADGTDRRKHLLLAIGIGEIEGWAEKARKSARAAETALADHCAALTIAASAAAAGPGAVAEAAAAAAAISAATARCAAITAAIDANRLAIAAFSAREAERRSCDATRAAAARRRAEAAARLDALLARAAEQHALLDGAGPIRERAARAVVLAAEIAPRRAELETTAAEEQRAWEEAKREEQIAETARARWRTADDRRKGAVERCGDQAAIEAAAVALPALQAAHEAALTRLDDAERAAEAARAAAVATTATRVTTLRGVLVSVEEAKRIDAARRAARAGLASDDAAVAGVDQAALDALAAEVTAARAARTVALDAFTAAERMAARRTEIAAAVAAIADALVDSEHAIAEGKPAKERGAAAKRCAEVAAARRAALEAVLVDLEAEHARVAPALAQEGEIGAATARLAEIEAQIVPARAEADAAAAELAAVAQTPEALPTPPRDDGAGSLAALATELGALGTREQLATRAAAAAAAAAETQARLEAALPVLEERAADAALLAECLGITGVQALEIDAAGPALTSNMNDLLHGSYGTRFTGEVNATRKSKDGKKTIDECEILVTDTLKKRVGDVRTYSGGERVHLSTAFFLALAQYVCAKRGMVNPTLVLDEPGGALGEKLIGPWMDMVRAAARRIRASKVVIITHNPQLLDAADAVVRVTGGRLVRER